MIPQIYTEYDVYQMEHGLAHGVPWLMFAVLSTSSLSFLISGSYL